MAIAVDVPSLIGLSAIISALVSAVLNYFINIRTFKKQNQIRLIEDKLAAYSYITFHIDKMRFKGEALKKHGGDTNVEDVYGYTDKEREEIFQAINKKIEEKYFLLNQDILKEWAWVSTLFAHESSKQHMSNLKNLIVKEYNDIIIPKYNKLTGNEISRIQ